MDSMDFWRLNDEFSILQILLLSLGYDPSGDMQYVERKSYDKQPKGYDPLKTLLMRSAKRGDLKVNLQYAPEYDGHGNECGISDQVCIERTTAMLGDIGEGTLEGVR
ncbi:MAG: hypothetical protein Q8K65_01840 [Alphaproteobacteria bacterium]|nr:hypothetical protein [Alphaproteobacteria bacterium]